MGIQPHEQGRKESDLWKIACDNLSRDNKELYDNFVEHVEDKFPLLQVDRPCNTKELLERMRQILQLKVAAKKKVANKQNEAQLKTLQNVLDHVGLLKDIASTAASPCPPAALVVGGIFVLVSLAENYISEKDTQMGTMLKISQINLRYSVELNVFKQPKDTLKAPKAVQQLLDALWTRLCEFYTEIVNYLAKSAKDARKSYGGVQNIFLNKWKDRLESLCKGDDDLKDMLNTISHHKINCMTAAMANLPDNNSVLADTQTNAVVKESEATVINNARVIKIQMQTDSDTLVPKQSSDNELQRINAALELRNKCNAEGRNVLHIVAVNGESGLIDTALRLDGTSVNHPTGKHGWTALHLAAEKGHLTFIKALLERKDIDVNAVTRSKSLTALHAAARGGKKGLVGFLVEKGIPVDKAAERGWTALHWAAYKGHLSTVRELLGRGARNDALSNWGETPLHLAVQIKRKGNKKTVKYFLEHYASSKYLTPTLGPYQGQTAEKIAAKMGNGDYF